MTIFNVDNEPNSYFEAESRSNPRIVVHHHGDTVSWIRFAELGAISMGEDMPATDFLVMLQHWESELIERVFADYVEHLAGQYDLVIHNVMDVRRRNERR